MAITFRCPNCDKHFTVADEHAGKRAKCKGCGAAMQIPGGQEDLEITPHPEPPVVRQARRPAPRPEPLGVPDPVPVLGAHESGGRRANIIALGVIILLGGLVPFVHAGILGKSGVSFPKAVGSS